jgi:chromosome condensin MukBEF ATPase and DNA-binding subunit MukB
MKQGASMAKSNTTELMKIERKGSALLTPLETEVAKLVVSTAKEYAEADVLLGDIRHARAKWKASIEPILQPLREAKTAADALNRKVDRPLEQLEQSVKEVMGEFKQKELRQLQKVQAEADTLRRQAEELAARESATRSRQTREKLALEQEKLETKIEKKLEQAPPVVKSSHSVAKTVKRWRITDTSKVLTGVLRGIIPPEVLAIDPGVVLCYFREDPTSVATWPGFELYDDIQIAGR